MARLISGIFALLCGGVSAALFYVSATLYPNMTGFEVSGTAGILATLALGLLLDANR